MKKNWYNFIYKLRRKLLNQRLLIFDLIGQMIGEKDIMTSQQRERWITWIMAYSVNGLLGNPLIEEEGVSLPAIIKEEFLYCFLGMEEEDREYILKELETFNINLVEHIKTRDKRRLIKFLMGQKLDDWANFIKLFNDKISYEENIVPWFEEFPFLKYETNLIVSYFKRKGIIVEGIDNAFSCEINSKAKYLTEEDRKEARKKTQEKYRRKKVKVNEYSLEKIIKKSEVDTYEYVENDFDAERYVDKLV